MTIQQKIFNQIKKVTHLLVSNSIAIDQNFPKVVRNEIVWNKYKNLSFTLKDEEYKILYNNCLKAHDYNLLLIDGAIVQLKYSFSRKEITSHILSYYPNPSIENFEEASQDFENTYFGDELFSYIVDKSIVTFPFRFDFGAVHTEIIHPYVHATFGNYKDCRIPINKPISPYNFINFILRNFYFTKLNECIEQCDFTCDIRINTTITNNEKKILHFNIE
jgi:hypothetical protein